jgi:diguanylate cyclase (GGDEF)-like protein/PAS domain S-box-containing protein
MPGNSLKSEKMLSSILQAMPFPVLLARLADGAVLYINPLAAEQLKLSPENKWGRKTLDYYVNPNDRPPLVERVMKEGRVCNYEVQFKNSEGQAFWALLSCQMFTYGQDRCLLTTFTNINEQKHSEEKLRLAAKVLGNTSESILITDSQGIIVEVNPAFIVATGYSREEALGQTTRALLRSDEQDADTYARMGKAMHKKGQWQGEIWSRRKNGEFYPERLSISTITNEKGEISHYLSISSDISERKKDEERLRFLANYDALTSLPNRNLFNLYLKDSLFQAQRYKRSLALFFIDLDHFKPINDSLGHDAGDDLLKEVASRLRSHLRQSDTVARFGGDEFLVLIPQYAEISGVVRVTKKILGEIERPFMICDKECRISASIGISLHPEDGSDAETLLKKADSAMYRAKEKGKNTFEFFSKISETQAYPASGPQQNT